MITWTILIFFIGCSAKDPTEPSNQEFEIHLQTWYSNTPVEVDLDNSLIMKDTISTGAIIAVAKIIPVTVSTGNHKLCVVANETSEHMELFEIRSKLYVGVIYNPTQSYISFNFQTEKFLYR